jgi:hypothetical protein
MPIYGIGEKVWYMRLQNKSANLQSKFVGPCEILRRVGQGSYLVRTKPGHTQHAHDDQLQRYQEDIYARGCKQLHYYKGSSRDIDWQTDEYEVEKTLAHQRKMENGSS